MTDQQAYAAAVHFLEEFWKRTKSDDVAGLLGDMALLEDGLPADAAVAHEWQRAVAYALNGGKASSLVLKRPAQKI